MYSHIRKILDKRKKTNQSNRYEKAKLISNQNISQIVKLIVEFVE